MFFHISCITFHPNWGQQRRGGRGKAPTPGHPKCQRWFHGVTGGVLVLPAPAIEPNNNEEILRMEDGFGSLRMLGTSWDIETPAKYLQFLAIGSPSDTFRSLLRGQLGSRVDRLVIVLHGTKFLKADSKEETRQHDPTL